RLPLARRGFQATFPVQTFQESQFEEDRQRALGLLDSGAFSLLVLLKRDQLSLDALDDGCLRHRALPDRSSRVLHLDGYSRELHSAASQKLGPDLPAPAR